MNLAKTINELADAIDNIPQPTERWIAIDYNHPLYETVKRIVDSKDEVAS